jgi:hypothetical protein
MTTTTLPLLLMMTSLEAVAMMLMMTILEAIGL